MVRQEEVYLIASTVARVSVNTVMLRVYLYVCIFRGHKVRVDMRHAFFLRFLTGRSQQPYFLLSNVGATR